MNPLRMSRVAAFGALGTIVLSGLASCESEQHTAKSTTHRDAGWSEEYYGYVPPDPWEVSRHRAGYDDTYGYDQDRGADRSASADADRTSSRARSTSSTSSAGDQVFYFPTGDRDSSVIQLRVFGPRQVQLGQPYSYNVEVTNLTRSGIADVVLRNAHADSSSSWGGSGQNGQSTLGYTEPSSKKTQDQQRQDFNQSTRDLDKSSKEMKKDAERAIDDFDDDDFDDDDFDDLDDDANELKDDADKARRDASRSTTSGSTTSGSTVARAPSTTQRPSSTAQAQARTAQPQRTAMVQASTNQNEWVIGHLGPGESKTIKIEGTANEVGMINHCLAVSFSPLACTTLEVINPQLQVTARGPEQALICDDIEYTYIVRNTGTGVARNVRIMDSLPSGFTTREGGREMNLPVGDIRPGETREVKARIRATQAGQLQTSAIAQSELGASDPAEFTTLVQQPALQVKVTGPQWLYAGQSAPFEVVVTNNGDGPAVDTMLEFNARNMSGEFGPRNLGRIEPGQSKKVSIPMTFGQAGATAADPGPITINAMARARCVESVTGSAQARLRSLPALLLETIDLTDPVQIGQNTTYQIAVKNQGTGVARNVKLNATLPAGLEFVNGTGDTRVRSDGKNVQFDPVASLNPGATARWNVTARAVSPGVMKFELRMQSEDLEIEAEESEPTTLFDPNAPASGGTTEEDRSQPRPGGQPNPNQPRNNQPNNPPPSNPPSGNRPG